MTRSTVKKNKHVVPEQNKPLSEEAIAARRQYYRDYEKRNKDKRRRWNQNHWEKVASQNAQERQED